MLSGCSLFTVHCEYRPYCCVRCTEARQRTPESPARLGIAVATSYGASPHCGAHSGSHSRRSHCVVGSPLARSIGQGGSRVKLLPPCGRLERIVEAGEVQILRRCRGWKGYPEAPRAASDAGCASSPHVLRSITYQPRARVSSPESEMNGIAAEVASPNHSRRSRTRDGVPPSLHPTEPLCPATRPDRSC